MACLLAPAAAAQRDAEPPRAEADARAARREVMRQFAEQIVAHIGNRMRSGIDYPKEALANPWEGRVWLAVLYPWGGGAERISVHRGSGYPVLDSKALEIVQDMQLPVRPGALRGAEFDVTFPIGFGLTVSPAE
jgi:TonB family protein